MMVIFFYYCDTITVLEFICFSNFILKAIIHPDTGQKIFMPFRMSGFVPFGTPICVGLLLPNQTFLSTTFWQWLNQSHNAGVNYSNRNATQVKYSELNDGARCLA